jgi:hypothetical protein
VIDHLELLKEKLAIDYSIWTVAFEKYDNNELHFVIRKKYETRITKWIKRQNPEDVYCSFGIHIYNISAPKKSKVVIMTAVYDHEYKEYQLNKKVFKRNIYIPIDIGFDNSIEISSDNIVVKIDNCKLEKNILNYAYRKHVLPTRLFSGFWIRFKLIFTSNFIWKIPEIIFGLSRILLLCIDGTKTIKNIIEVHFNERDGKAKGNSFNEDSYQIEFMSIKVKGFSAFTYSLLHLMGAYAYFSLNYSNEFISKIGNNVFLGLTYVVVTLSLWSRFIPNGIKAIIKWSAKISCKERKPIRI